MTKLFKKSLALMLTLAICLSAMACCFIVSAEGETTPAGSISFVLADGTTEINPGATVLVNVVADWTGVAGAEFTVTGLPSDATVATTNTELVLNLDATAGTVKFADGNNGELSDEAPLFSISFTAGAKDTTYTFKIDEDTAVFCNLAEEDVTVTSEATSFTVVEKVVEPEVPECEHEWEVVAATPATADADGSITLNCTKCDEADGTVEPVKYHAYSILATPQIGCTSTTELIFRTPMAAYGATSEEGFLFYTQTFADGSNKTVAIPAIDEYKTSYGYEWPVPVFYTGFSEEFETSLYVKRDGVWTNGGTSVRSVKSVVMDTIIKYTGIDENTRKVAANLLYAGARTQEEFGYGIDNLADSDLIGDYAKYIDTSTPELNKTPGENWTEFPTDYQGKAVFATPKIVLGDAVAVRHTVVLNYYTGNKNDIKLKYEYTSYDGTPMSGYLDGNMVNENKYEFDLGVYAPDMRAVVYFTVCNGETPISDVSPYSVESVMKHYHAQNISVATIEAVMNYSDATYDLFSK